MPIPDCEDSYDPCRQGLLGLYRILLAHTEPIVCRVHLGPSLTDIQFPLLNYRYSQSLGLTLVSGSQ